MQRTYIMLVSLVLLGGSAQAEPLNSKNRFGLGLELGAPSGLAGKYFLGGQAAIQGGIGVLEGWYDDGWQLHTEVVWHPAVLHRGRSVTIPLHVGVGGYFWEHRYVARCFDGRESYICDGGTSAGVRAPIGLSFLFKKVPMDLFVEVALAIDLIETDDYMYYDHDRMWMQGTFGGRFYF